MPWRRQRSSRWVSSLDLHPNLAEILGVLSQVPRLTGGDIANLAQGWRDTHFLHVARAHALGPDTPLVLEVLATFERVDRFFREELSRSDDFRNDDFRSDDLLSDDGAATAVKPQVVKHALHAVRDAVAAVYARPILSRAEYMALIGPWHRAFSQ
jgi:hypothetical protein